MRVIASLLSSALLVSKACCATTLKILPLGDSITYGLFSTDGNGYRGQLYSDLTPEYDVELIGSVRSGIMLDNNNDGYIGYQISQIAAIAAPALFLQPDIVLLHAGSNDCIFDLLGQPVDQAPERLATLMAGILNLAPNTLLLVAQVVGTANPIAQARINAFNKQVPTLVAKYANTKYRVRTVDMTSITGADTVDGVHPDEAAYHKMGDLWYAAIQSAAKEGLLDNETVVTSTIISSSAFAAASTTTASATPTSAPPLSIFVAASSSATPTFVTSSSTIPIVVAPSVPASSSKPAPSPSSSSTSTTSRPTTTPVTKPHACRARYRRDF